MCQSRYPIEVSQLFSTPLQQLSRFSTCCGTARGSKDGYHFGCPRAQRLHSAFQCSSQTTWPLKLTCLSYSGLNPASEVRGTKMRDVTQGGRAGVGGGRILTEPGDASCSLHTHTHHSKQGNTKVGSHISHPPSRPGNLAVYFCLRVPCFHRVSPGRLAAAGLEGQGFCSKGPAATLPSPTYQARTDSRVRGDIGMKGRS
jgi:hypothetical protein